MNRIAAIRESAAHWLAYQKTAIKLNTWSPRFLLHDVEKMILCALLGDKVSTKLHRIISSHHDTVFHGRFDKIGAAIDWECARFTKPSKPLNARQTWQKFYSHIDMADTLHKLGL
ncbi:MAG: hypothetical protein EOM80_19155 [Erysipelotrichia bacterium]|nr:hypothetical protein [Erysipelotrichia bacterium]